MWADSDFVRRVKDYFSSSNATITTTKPPREGPPEPSEVELWAQVIRAVIVLLTALVFISVEACLALPLAMRKKQELLAARRRERRKLRQEKQRQGKQPLDVAR